MAFAASKAYQEILPLRNMDEVRTRRYSLNDVDAFQEQPMNCVNKHTNDATVNSSREHGSMTFTAPVSPTDRVSHFRSFYSSATKLAAFEG